MHSSRKVCMVKVTSVEQGRGCRPYNYFAQVSIKYADMQ